MWKKIAFHNPHLFLHTAGLQVKLQERPSVPSEPKLLPYDPPHVVAGRALAKRKAKAPEFSELLVDNFASGASSGAKAFGAETISQKQYDTDCNDNIYTHNLTISTGSCSHFGFLIGP